MKGRENFGKKISANSETPHVKRAQIGFNFPAGDILEKACGRQEMGRFALQEALAGAVFHFSLEHISRLVADMITVGRDVYSAQSWRYVRIKIDEGDFSRIHPAACFEKYGLSKDFISLARLSLRNYEKLTTLGIPPEDARFAFLWSFDYNIVVTLQGPKIVDFTIRNLNSPYEAVREAAGEVLGVFGQEFPRVAHNLTAIARKEKLSAEETAILEKERAYLYGKGKPTVSWLIQEPVEAAAVAARACYQEKPPSEFVGDFPLENQLRVLAATISAGHTSVTEHPHFSVSFSMSEAGIQQLRRHRIPVQEAKPVWETAREGYDIIVPPSIEAHREARGFLSEVHEASMAFRRKGLGRGVPEPELDHGVIIAVKVPAFLVTNATDFLHIGERRLCGLAQWEIRDWTYKVAEVLVKSAPPLFETLGPACFRGGCREGKRSCGKPQIYRQWRDNLRIYRQDAEKA